MCNRSAVYQQAEVHFKQWEFIQGTEKVEEGFYRVQSCCTLSGCLSLALLRIQP